MESNFLLVLLVDDDEDEYVLLNDLVDTIHAGTRGVRIQLDWAASYQAALQAARDKPYDIFLVDHYLGSETGLDLLRAWRAQGVHTPAILLTGQTSYELDLAAMQQGAVDFISKTDLTATLLERSIRYSLEHSRAQAELEQRVRERTAELEHANQILTGEIAARQQIESALVDSEARLRALADSTSAAIFIIQDDLIRYANPAARFVTGYTPEELTGTPFWKLAHPTYQSHLRASGVLNQWDKTIPARFELKIITASGETRWVDLTAGALIYEGRQAAIVTAFDITERDRAEKALYQAKMELEQRVLERTRAFQQANQKLRTVLDTLPVAIWIAAADGSIEGANRMVDMIWGGELPPVHSVKDYALLQGWWSGSGESLSPEDWALARALLNGENVMGDVVDILRLDGSTATLLVSAAPIQHAAGHITGAVMVAQDITRQRQLERELQESKLQAEILAGISQALAQVELDYQTVLDTITEEITRSMGDGAILRLVSGDGQWVEPVSMFFRDPNLLEGDNSQDLFREPISDQFVGHVARTGEPLVLIETSAEEIQHRYKARIYPLLKRLRLRSLLLVPLRAGDEIIGTLTAMRSAALPPFNLQDLSFLQDLAGRAALAIENARLHMQMKVLATRDSLTGQYNRRAIFDLGEVEMEHFLATHSPLSAIMLDIDHFKSINDRFGHMFGDQVLQLVMEYCRQNIRQDDILGRYGGDEFAIVLPDTDPATAHIVAGRIRESVAQAPFQTPAGQVGVSISVGVAEATPNMNGIQDLLDAADQALYLAKRGGRNRVEIQNNTPSRPPSRSS